MVFEYDSAARCCRETSLYVSAQNGRRVRFQLLYLEVRWELDKWVTTTVTALILKWHSLSLGSFDWSAP